MASFSEIPYNDINYLLISNNIFGNNPERGYLTAWNLIQQNQVTNVPESIADWIIAYNLSTQQIPTMNASDILLANNQSLTEISNILTIPINKERIIRILKYLRRLNDDSSLYDRLPQDLIIQLMRTFDNDTLLLSCDFSQSFKNVCDKGIMIAILKNNLRLSTGLNVNHFNIDQLKRLSQYNKSNGRKYLYPGFYRSFIINEGHVYSFGLNEVGQLGLGDEIDKNVPTLIPNLNNVIQIGVGESDNTLFLNENGEIYVFGANDYGQIGMDLYNYYTPIPVINPRLQNVIGIFVAGESSFVFDNNGQTYVFGFNQDNQLILENNHDDQYVPIVNPRLQNIVQISGIFDKSIVLDNEGNIRIYGSDAGFYSMNWFERFLSQERIKVVSVAAGNNHYLLLADNGRVYSFGSENLGLGDRQTYYPTIIPNMVNIIAIAVGYNHTLALTNDGHVYSFGDDNFDQLGLGNYDSMNVPVIIPNLNNIIEIACGPYTSFALNNQGEVYAWGQNTYGELGVGDNNNRNIPTLIPNFRINF